VTLGWAEIKNRAARFARDNAEASYEKGETQTFYNEFFEIFGVARKRVAVYEKLVKKLDDSKGFIDLFWPGVLIVEQKSAGRDLDAAVSQAHEYCVALKPEEFPRYILACDFQTFHLYDLERGKDWEFSLGKLASKIEHFGFVLGREPRIYADQPDANIKATELMGAVHDALEESKYVGHDLERFLVRLLFCMFADDTGIFQPRGIFETWLQDRTSVDGSGLGGQLSELFQVLDTPEEDRGSALDEDLTAFPYINGDLFKLPLKIPAFTEKMRSALIEASEFKWESVSPAIFGSLFQSVMNREERRKLGAHYTSEKNIMKLIRPLFLEGLENEFARIRTLKRNRATELRAFQEELGRLKFLDPACGCGNFLIIAYRELRLLELEVLKELRADDQLQLDATTLSLIDVDQFYGIEKEEFPARIAEVAMWMMDHIMNTRLGVEFGPVYRRIPLKKSPHILCDNALRFGWESLLPSEECSYVLGNPPFRGHQYRDDDQQADMHLVWGKLGQVNRLDYVTCWFKLAVEYVERNHRIKIGFVSTNSITQGEQAGILWAPIFAKGFVISFAHRSFQWNSEARGKAAVHCVIIGLVFGPPPDTCLIYDYITVRGEPHEHKARQINGYLTDGPHYSLPRRGKPQPGKLPMFKGSQPTDGARIKKPGGGYLTFSNLILTEEQKTAFLRLERNASKWLRPYVGGDELLSGEWRWCLWLKDVPSAELRKSKPLAERLDRVKKAREGSTTESVKAMAKSPTLFTQDRQPSVPYLCLPEVSSETREYLPLDILPPNVIASNKLQIMPGADLLYFAVLSSSMHMAWMRTVAGRLKSDYSYSPAVYYTFPWPEISESEAASLKDLARAIRKERASEAPSSLSDMYEPDFMPPRLRKAHLSLDRAVERLYRTRPFSTERERVEHLFSLFEARQSPQTAELFPETIDSTYPVTGRRKRGKGRAS
jgi:hypothetical protein